MSLQLRFASLGLVFLMSGLAGGCSALVDADPADLPPVPGADGGGMDGGRADAGDGGGGGTDGGGGGTDGGDPCAGGCDDGIACSVDACGASGCTHTPDDGACGGERKSPATALHEGMTHRYLKFVHELLHLFLHCCYLDLHLVGRRDQRLESQFEIQNLLFVFLEPHYLRRFLVREGLQFLFQNLPSWLPFQIV